MTGRAVDLSGQVFGRLTVLHRALNKPREGAKWTCLCSCGVRRTTHAQSLKASKTQSCGGLNRERSRLANTTHGASYTRLYAHWNMMMKRCASNQPRLRKYYKDRGITVCAAWRRPKIFMRWAAKKWKSGLTLERKNVFRRYSARNCTWVPSIQQKRNTSASIFIRVKGKRMTLAEAARAHRVPISTVRHRHRKGFPRRVWFLPSGSLR